MKPQIHFIGCGRLGKALAVKLKKAASISGIVNTSIDSAAMAVQWIGEGTAYAHVKHLPPADIYFITTPDSIIQRVCDELSALHHFKPSAIIVHCSGALTSHVLQNAKRHAVSIASLHPLQSVASHAIKDQFNAPFYCTLEGDEDALPFLTDLCHAIGANVLCIDKKNKGLYHAACVIANNYLVTLHHHAMCCLQAAGIDNEEAKPIISLLMEQALRNLNHLDHQKALTGPLARGDVHTIQSHFNSLQSYSLTQQMYTALGLATLPLTSHDKNKKHALQGALSAGNGA